MWFRISDWKLAAGALVLVACLGASLALTAEKEDLVRNGGFERGPSGWLWQQWKGKPLPGYVDREDMHEGLASFKLHKDGIDHTLTMAQAVTIDPSRDYVMSIALKPQQMPAGAARVRVLLDKRGWYGRGSGRVDLVKTGGTQDWQTYTAALSASALKGAAKLTIFIYHDKPDQGSLGIDALSLKPARAQGQAALSSRPAPASGGLDAVTYATGNPVVLIRDKDASLAIRVSPERALYRTGELPRVTVQTAAIADATLSWRVLDGFGRALVEKTAAAGDGATIEVPLPPGHGYYEIVAALRKGGRTLAEMRRSLGALPPPADPSGDEPFGMWIQGERLYPELGVRWVRDGINWNVYRAQGDRYLRQRLELYRWFRQHNIRVLAYPKRHPKPYETSREVIEDTPEAWRAQEEWWIKMVSTLGEHVDAWGVVNEPMRGHWKGDDRLILRYWALMRRIVDRYDPGTPLIGPSLNPNTPSLVEQYRDLLNMGFGRYIDAIEMHTYATSPEDGGWDASTRRIRDMTRQATGNDLSVWSTEHGSSATYANELLQAQHLMRSWLEAKKIGYPVVIWHMFSHPQGKDSREIQFGIFRNARQRNVAPPQPRPAGLAYGVMTRQLAGAVYKTRLDHFGPAINAYVFERDGKAMVALWTTSTKTYDVTLPIGEEKAVTATGLFGRVEPLKIQDGLVHVTVDKSPKFIAPLPASYLRREPVARLEKPVEVLPGQTAEATMTLANPTANPARLRVEWLPADGWRFGWSRDQWSLAPRQSVRVPLTVTALRDLPIGRYQIHAKVFLDGKYITALSAPAAVLPQVAVVSVGPRFERGRPALAGTLRRIDPSVREAAVQLADRRSARSTVDFGSRDMADFVLPVEDPPTGALENLVLNIYGAQGKVQSTETLRMSFVPVAHLARPPSIDGKLDDWPGTRRDESLNVRWGWDEGHLYLAVRVPDRRHVQKHQLTQMWKDDSLQIGLAPARGDQLVRAFLPGLQEAEMMELDVALRDEGAAMYRHRTMNKHLAPVGPVTQKQSRYAVRHGDGATVYEMQIPVEQVGLKPLRGGEVLRGSLLVNANDGSGRRSTEWFGGIREAKDPELFGHLILQD